MGIEIERKFIVRGDDYKAGITPVVIRQGFISTDMDSVIRVRIFGSKGFLAVKGSGTGISRTEYEYEIPLEDAREMLDKFCAGKSIEKLRYVVSHVSHKWEVDVFMKENSGLVIAEIELLSEDETIVLPPWVGEEVTGDPRYYNANLINHPYSSW